MNEPLILKKLIPGMVCGIGRRSRGGEMTEDRQQITEVIHTTDHFVVGRTQLPSMADILISTQYAIKDMLN